MKDYKHKLESFTGLDVETLEETKEYGVYVFDEIPQRELKKSIDLLMEREFYPYKFIEDRVIEIYFT